MGLDQYAYAVHKEDVVDNFNIKYDCRVTELFYWRKHPDLHGWMELLYEDYGGTGVFNGKLVRLYPEHLKQLKKDVKKKRLPHTSGFFFGESDAIKDKMTLEFIDLALDKIKEGYAIYYDSSW